MIIFCNPGQWKHFCQVKQETNVNILVFLCFVSCSLHIFLCCFQVYVVGQCYGVGLCYGDSLCYNVSLCFSVSLSFGVNPCYGFEDEDDEKVRCYECRWFSLEGIKPTVQAQKAPLGLEGLNFYRIT